MREFSNNRPDIVETIDSLSKKTDEMSYEKEEMIAKNLDFALRSGNLKKLPLSVINRILNSPSRILKDHHLLHRFVVDTIKRYSSKSSDMKDETDEENLMILPGSLDYAEMTNKELEELFEIEETTKYFNPKNADTRIRRFLKDNQLLEEKCLSFEEKIEQMRKNEEELEKKINILIDTIGKMNEKEENQIKKMNALESKLNNNILPKINKYDEYEEKSAAQQVKLEERINNIETLIQKQTNSIHKEFEEQEESIKTNNLILQEKLQQSLKQIQNLFFYSNENY